MLDPKMFTEALDAYEAGPSEDSAVAFAELLATDLNAMRWVTQRHLSSPEHAQMRSAIIGRDEKYKTLHGAVQVSLRSIDLKPLPADDRDAVFDFCSEFAFETPRLDPMSTAIRQRFDGGRILDAIIAFAALDRTLRRMSWASDSYNPSALELMLEGELSSVTEVVMDPNSNAVRDWIVGGQPDAIDAEALGEIEDIIITEASLREALEREIRGMLTDASTPEGIRNSVSAFRSTFNLCPDVDFTRGTSPDAGSLSF